MLRPIFPNDRYRQVLSRKPSIHQTPFALQVSPFRAIHLKMILLFWEFLPFVLQVRSGRGYYSPTDLHVGDVGLQSAKHFVGCPIRHYENLLHQRQSPIFCEARGCLHRSRKERNLGNPK